MEKNISKKLFAGVCALSAAFILASCDPISVVPSNYNDPIVLDEAGNAIDDDDNKLGKIFDSLASDRNSKIVSDLLDRVAIKRFGTFDDIKSAHESGDLNAYFAKIMYKDKDGNDTCVFFRDGDDKFAGKSVEEVRAKRFDIFYKDIMSRINEFFYNEITSGSYNDEEGRFDESKLWNAHYYEFYDLKPIAEADYKNFFVTNSVTKENAYEEYLNKDAYTYPGKRGYIEEKVFPQILKDKLVEEYIYNNNYNSLGRAYARKVSYVKIAYEDTDAFAWKLLKSYADAYIVDDATRSHTTGENASLLGNFEIVVKALKGFDDVGAFIGNTQDGIKRLDGANASKEAAAANALLAGSGSEVIHISNDDDPDHMDHYKLGDVQLIEAGDYYKETKLGKLLESYEKAITAEKSGRFPIASDKAELDKFATNGKSKAYGLREKLISLAKEDYTTDGWFVKSGGLSELPSALRDRLFNINIANTLDNGSLKYEDPSVELGQSKDVDGIAHYGVGSYETDKDNTVLKRTPYARNINGNKFVVPAKAEAFADNHYNYLYRDKEGKAFYIVKVEEAPSTPKLNLESSTSYSKIQDTKNDVFKTEEIARAVAKVLGTKDSYIKDAYTEILNEYTFEFYETSLYEYFKSEYPDLDMFQED